MTAVASKVMGGLIVLLLFATVVLSLLLSSAQTDLDRVSGELKEERSKSDLQEQNFNGCLGKLSQQNQSLANLEQEAARKADAANTAATNEMAKLPAKIKQDHTTVVQPDAANTWIKDLFQ